MTAPEVPDPPAEMLMWVDPEWIRQQRDQGWPDMHPEDYCHRCGARNASWYAEREDWLAATSAWAAETGHEGICCPTCFIETRAQSPEDRASGIKETAAGISIRGDQGCDYYVDQHHHYRPTAAYDRPARATDFPVMCACGHPNDDLARRASRGGA